MAEIRRTLMPNFKHIIFSICIGTLTKLLATTDPEPTYTLTEETLCVCCADTHILNSKIIFAEDGHTISADETVTVSAIDKIGKASLAPNTNVTLTITTLYGNGDMVINGAGTVEIASALTGGNYTVNSGILKIYDHAVDTVSANGDITINAGARLDCIRNIKKEHLTTGKLILKPGGILILGNGEFDKNLNDQ